MPDLTPKQARFVAEYLKDLNAKQAAIRAGYSKKTAEMQGSRLLRYAQVKAAVAAGTAKHLEKAELTVERTLEAVRRIVEADIRRLFDEQGNIRPLHQLSAEDAALIAGFEYIIKNAEAGDGHTDRVLKVRLKEQAKFVELAMKYLGLLKDVVKVEGDWDKFAAELASARLRGKK